MEGGRRFFSPSSVDYARQGANPQKAAGWRGSWPTLTIRRIEEERGVSGCIGQQPVARRSAIVEERIKGKIQRGRTTRNNSLGKERKISTKRGEKRGDSAAIPRAVRGAPLGSTGAKQHSGNCMTSGERIRRAQTGGVKVERLSRIVKRAVNATTSYPHTRLQAGGTQRHRDEIGFQRLGIRKKGFMKKGNAEGPVGRGLRYKHPVLADGG